MWSMRRSILIGLMSALFIAGANGETRLKLGGEDVADDAKQAEKDGAEKQDKTADSKPEGRRAPRSKTRAEQAQSRPSKSTARRAPKKATKIPPAANTIVQELKGEFERGKLRDKSDYLTAEPNAEMTADVILAMLGRRLGTSESMDAYVKWQLLSGLPETIPDELSGDAVAAYRNAPGLEWRPGITQDQKRALDREVKRSENASDLLAMLVDEVRRVDILNEPVERYREALFAKLPDSFETMQAALLDIYQRGEAGFTPRKFIDVVSRRISTWSGNASAAELADMADMLEELAAAEMPSYYDTVRVSQSDDTFKWESKKANLNDGRKLEDLADEIGKKAQR